MELGALLADATDRLLADLCVEPAFAEAREGRLSAERWARIEEAGLPLVLVPEDAGGLGVPLADAAAPLRLVGRHAAPFPIAETMVANALLAKAGLPLATGPASVACGSPRVPWGASVETVVVERDGITALTDAAFTERGTCPAGWPRDTLVGAVGAPLPLPAFARAQMMAGALERVLELTIEHVSTRVQFGKPLAAFQATQQALAVLAGEVAAGRAAADHAAERFGPDPIPAVAVARIRLGEAAAKAIAIAHQLHGAIGFTREHPLHRCTTALMTWRDEYGTQAWWTRRLGRAALAAGRDGYWPMVTAA
jgi:acyl-CoA dehydrogenase